MTSVVNISREDVLQQQFEKLMKDYQRLFDENPFIMLIADKKTNQFIEGNNAAIQSYGYAKEELFNLTLNDLSGGRKNINENSNNCYHCHYKKSGEVLFVEVKTTDTVYKNVPAELITVTDVTAKVLLLEQEKSTTLGKRAIFERPINSEWELANPENENSSKFIETIIEGISDCFFVVNHNWIITYWNKAAEQLLQKKATEVLGHHLDRIHVNGIGEKFVSEFKKVMRTKNPHHFEGYSTNLNLWLDVSVYPTTVGLTIYVKDITCRKRHTSEVLNNTNNQNILINSTSDLIWSLDTNLKLVSFNTAYKNRIAHVVGFPAYEGLQLPAVFENKKDQNKWVNYYKKALKGESFNVDEAFPDAHTGITKYTDISFRPIHDTNTNLIIGVACHSRNITERVEHQLLIEEQNKKLILNEEHLQRLRAKLEKVMNSSLDIICSIDTSGRFVQVSEASSYVLGFTPEEITGRYLLEFVAADYADLTKNANAQLKDGYDLIGFNNVLIHKNGERVFLTWSARLDPSDGLVYAVGRDATSLIQAENMKAAIEQRFTALVQKGADLVGIIDIAGNYLYTSPNIEDILGYTPEYLAQKNALELIHIDDVSMVQSQLEKVVKGGEVKVTAFRFKHANGEWRWFETIATNQLLNPAINGIVVNSRDITSRKQIETEREVIIKELLKSNADLKQFSFITSHNLRAPLSNITGILNIVDYPSLNEYNQQMVDMLNVSSKQLQKTIDDLSDILLIKNNVSVEITTVNLEDAIDEVKKTFISTLNDVCANIYTDFKAPSIKFSKTYLQSILVNLVSNSIKYRSAERNLVINVSSHGSEDGNIIFIFSDNGTGIDVNMHKNKLFGLYQRFHSHIDGHGLGLFIIKSQINALGGKIELESEPGKGTSFIITFKNHSDCGPDENKENKTRCLQLNVF